jgi:DNA-binding transcriptional regulator YiaG
VDFYVTLSTWAIGCLQVFKQAAGRLKDPRRVFYDWTAKLEKDERQALNYVQGFSALASYYDAAAGLTPAQSRLRTWMEDQLTRRSDATAKGRNVYRVNPSAADAGEPRVYTWDFCPLLEKGRGYHAALGHFPQANNAETGRTLRGRSQGPTTTGGPRSGGLLEALGYELPPGRAVQAREAVVVAALKDLRAVVEEYLGGRVVGRRGGVWLSLHEAERIRAEELLGEVSWFLFLPEDWLARAQKTFEDHHRRRYERGETDRPVRVTTSNAPTMDAASAGEVGLDAAELRVRLHAKRRERELTSDAVGKVFGVSKMTVSNWERGRDAGGAPIPEDLQPLILRWIEKGEGPTEDELKTLAARRRGGKKRASP